MHTTEVASVLQKLKKWADYPSCGTVVLPSRLIPSKTPLDTEIVRDWTLDEHTLSSWLTGAAAIGCEIGAIIDLANHECLYRNDLPDNIEYFHIELVAKELPPPTAVDTVIQTAENYYKEHPDKYIGIHCAYGFNRTGFVVCCHLIQSFGFSVSDAIQSFANARPPGIKHEKFIDELYRRYGPGLPLPMLLTATTLAPAHPSRSMSQPMSQPMGIRIKPLETCSAFDGRPAVCEAADGKLVSIAELFEITSPGLGRATSISMAYALTDDFLSHSPPSVGVGPLQLSRRSLDAIERHSSGALNRRRLADQTVDNESFGKENASHMLNGIRGGFGTSSSLPTEPTSSAPGRAQ